MTCHLMGMTGDDSAYSRPMIIRKCSQAKGGPRQLLCQAMQRQSWHLTSAPQCRDDDNFFLCSPGCLDYTTFMYSTSKAGELVFTCRGLMELTGTACRASKARTVSSICIVAQPGMLMQLMQCIRQPQHQHLLQQPKNHPWTGVWAASSNFLARANKIRDGQS